MVAEIRRRKPFFVLVGGFNTEEGGTPKIYLYKNPLEKIFFG